MIIKADLHTHTKYSLDGIMTVEDIITECRKKGIGAVAVCDHNSFNGSRELLAKCPPDIIPVPAVEYSTNAGHILGLFLYEELDEKYLVMAGSNVFQWDKIVDGIKDSGGIPVIAHPFATRYGLTTGENCAIEVFNARTGMIRPFANKRAMEEVKKGIVYTAGSDAHTPWEIGNAFLEVEVSEMTAEALKEALIKAESKVWGKDTHMIFIAISQLYKSIRTKNYKDILKKFCYLTYATTLDFLSLIGIIKRNKGSFIKINNRT